MPEHRVIVGRLARSEEALDPIPRSAGQSNEEARDLIPRSAGQRNEEARDLIPRSAGQRNRMRAAHPSATTIDVG
jgi:hypothetical protein